ncbi:cysteine desulfurase family protein [Alicyclobacillus sp. ALC3]|uniref:cysteine desulfurase family protein n=1 Tax=Alicyclobacillus sp. ALC3 TaxID=2796143 RepID=UPI002378E3E9|nr:cysteine desulfurase family protein [Alicyclobacillus sp. ALC3]WDL96303.1 cysteine desulfurase [Alicyclobacillus sp. ALC3]
MIYLDNAATTPLLPQVRTAMLPFLDEHFGNPSSVHSIGREARRAVEIGRERVARLLGCSPERVVFTSGGTEANESALVGAWLAARKAGRTEIVTTAVEHHAVLEPCEMLQSFAAKVTYVAPRPDGGVEIEDILAAVTDKTAVVSVMYVNNELGTVNDVAAIAAAIHERDPNVIVHSDMVQAAPVVRLYLEDTQVDLATISAHKLHGPKGVGALYVRKGRPWQPVLRGGNQEQRRRAGTENTAGIVGFGEAADRLSSEFEGHLRHLKELRAVFRAGLATIPEVVVNSPDDASPAIVNVRFAGILSERLLMRLDLAGVAASAGAACTAGSLEPSHVLVACGQSLSAVKCAVRFSFSSQTATSEVRRAMQILSHEVAMLRQTNRIS